MEQIDHEWTTLNEVLERKGKIVNDQTDALRAKIVAEDKVVNQKIADITASGPKRSPYQGQFPQRKHRSLCNLLILNLLNCETSPWMVSKAKEALNLPAIR